MTRQIDYLTISGTGQKSFYRFINLFFGYDTDYEIDYILSRRMGYTQNATLKGVTVYLNEIVNDSEDFRYCFQVSGEGCALLEDKNKWGYLFCLVWLGVCNITRLDIKADLPVNINSILGSIAEEKTSFTQKTFKKIISTSGKSFYAGARTSEVFIRIYDKVSEMSGTEVPGSMLTRVEFELKSKMCREMLETVILGGDLWSTLVMKHITSDIIKPASNALYIDFERQSDIDKTRFLEYCKNQIPVMAVYFNLIGVEAFMYQIGGALSEVSGGRIKSKYREMLKNE